MTLNGRFRALVESMAIYFDELNKIPAYHDEADRWLKLCRRIANGQTDPQTPPTEKKTD